MLAQDMQGTLSIDDITGRAVVQQSFKGAQVAVDLSGLPKGLYHYTIDNAQSLSYSKGKIVKQ